MQRNMQMNFMHMFEFFNLIDLKNILLCVYATHKKKQPP